MVSDQEYKSSCGLSILFISSNRKILFKGEGGETGGGGGVSDQGGKIQGGDIVGGKVHGGKSLRGRGGR